MCSGRCSRLRRVGLVVATMWLSGCAAASFDPGPVCPPVPEYSAAFQAHAAEEVEALPEGAVLLTMMQDYAVMREQARACDGR